MKEEIKAFFAKLGIGKVESNADGVFMKDEDVQKMMLVNQSNETLTASLQAEKDGRVADNAAKDAIISALNTDKANLTSANSALTTENTRLTTELAAAKAGETVIERKADPIPGASVKKKLTKNQIAAEKNAAALRGDANTVDDEDEEDDEIESPEGKK